MKEKRLIPIIIAFLAIYIIWGSTYLFNKILVEDLPPFLFAGIRFVLAGLIILAISLVRGKLELITRKQLLNSAWIGFLFLTVGNGCVVWALQFIDSGFTALLISTQPLITIVLMYFIDAKPIQAKSIIGIVLGMVGIYLLVNQNELNFGPNKWWGIAAVYIALISWGYGSIVVSKADLPQNSFITSGYQMLIGGGMMLVVSIFLREPVGGLFQMDAKAIWSMAFLVIFGSIIAFTAFNYLLKYVSPEKVATSTYINPIVALILGWWVLDELITDQSMIAAVILLTGVYFINSTKVKGKEPKKINKN